MFQKTALWMPLLIAAASQTGCVIDDFGVGHFNSDFHYSFPLSAQGRVSVESFNGAIDISAWDQPTVDISGTKYAPTQGEADALKIDVDHSSDSVSVRAAHPSDWRGNRGAKFAIKIPRGAILDRIVTSNGHIEASDASGPARLKTSNGAVRVNRFKGTLDVQTSNSPIELDQVEGDVTAHSSNGHVHANGLRGGLQADTSNGGVNVEIAGGNRPVRIGTSNGGVELTLPPNFSGGSRVHTNNNSIKVYLAEPANARVTAHTSNASVTCEFDIRVHGEIGKHDMEGEIGNGGSALDLTSSNGSIKILKR